MARALRSKIKPITSGGIPGEVRKINELIEQVNHLNGMTTINGQPIADGATGPIIDLQQVNQPEPWTVDPNGNPAGWVQYNVCVAGVSTPKWFWGQTN
jgi:hypothetical protein